MSMKALMLEQLEITDGHEVVPASPELKLN